MISTQLHNQLIDDMAYRITMASKEQSYKLKFENRKTKLIYIFKIILAILILLLLILLLYKTFTSIDNSIDKSYPKKAEQPYNNQAKQTKRKKVLDNENNLVYKNGIEYIKRDNHVYQRVWETGILVEEIRLEETIEKSRQKNSVDIPQLSIRKDGKEK
ncbi:MAG: hypothetical protein U9N59_00980 [Campylobacterota bacterium]|nr:hypothetical protein [Campylobacterota bacterium]